MPALASQRCLNHSSREAVARCPGCGLFFCRECITEHDDRVICAACLRKLAFDQARPPRKWLNFWPAAQGAAGLCIAWFVFYVIGRLLLAIPDEFHDEAIWKTKWMNAFEQRDDE